MESTAASVADPAPAPGRNPGMPLDLSWVESLQVNRSAAERRVASLSGRRSVKKDAQAAWLLKALTCIDLTALGGDGGVIAVAPDGQIAWSYNTSGMYRASMAEGRPLTVGIYKDEP